MMSRGIDCVIPAAGVSSRFGTNKLLQPWSKKTVIESVVDQALRFCSRVILVTGNGAEEIENLCSSRQIVTSVRNDAYEDGMFSSIQTGLSAVKTDRFLVMMGDMPGVPDEVIETLLRIPGKHWSRPQYGSKPGHPVFISRELLPELLAMPRSTGAMRDVLRNYPGREFVTTDPGVFLDVDTEEDYNKLKSIKGA